MLIKDQSMPTDLTIRKYDDGDKDQVVSLWNEVLPSSRPWNEPNDVIRRKLLVNDQLFFVGELDGKIISTVIAGFDGIRGWIYSVAVANEHRRHGIGGRMMENAERALLARGCPKINLQVLGSNNGVVPFYENIGYTVEERISMGKPLVGEKIRTDALDTAPRIEVNKSIRLSPMRYADKPALLAHLNETDEFNRFIWPIPYPYTDLDADEFLARVAQHSLAVNKTRNWAIRNEADELIGGCGLRDVAIGQKAEIGYWLAKPFWGQGVMTNVVRALCDFAFAEYRFVRVFARALASNIGSKRVLEKAGFEQEGYFRRHEFRDGQAFDVVFYGRLNS